MTLTLRQLVGTWVAGSATTGTIAVLFTLHRVGLPFTPFNELPGLSVAGVFAMLAALLAALALLAWGTVEVAWLPATPRGRTLWVLLVAGAGLLLWGFGAAAAVSAEFELWMLLAVSYVFGGLPFTLIAALLLRPVVANVVAAVLTGFLLLLGTVMMGGDPVGVCVTLLWFLFGQGVTLP